MDLKYTSEHAFSGHKFYMEQKYTSAESELRAAIKLAPNDAPSHRRLMRTLFKQGKEQEAKNFGLETLRLNDRMGVAYADKYLKGLMLNQNEISKKRVFNTIDKSKNIISFCLWGNKDIYCSRAIENVRRAQIIYPEWTCRFYCDADVPKKVIDTLKKEGAQVLFVQGGLQKHDRLFWRFFVADDSKVDRFICRDCDSLLNCQERVAVDDWIESGKPFHVMRDFVTHVDVMLAGMWGGLTNVLPPILGTLLTPQYLSSHTRETDQIFLRERVWGLIREDVFVHDSYYSPDFGVPFPKYGRLIRPAHVGGS
ncbi:MAG: tetratricopeptide repeat protein [Methylocystaceae bacterium]|nr:tetratricopeptide repeat protein [Methylocystaceae bacterium]